MKTCTTRGELYERKNHAEAQTVSNLTPQEALWRFLSGTVVEPPECLCCYAKFTAWPEEGGKISVFYTEDGSVRIQGSGQAAADAVEAALRRLGFFLQTTMAEMGTVCTVQSLQQLFQWPRLRRLPGRQVRSILLALAAPKALATTRQEPTER